MSAKVSAHCLPVYPEPRLITFEPTMPMDQPLERLQPGTIIEIAGHVLDSPKRFSVNLVTDRGDIALHVNPRFDVGNVVLNTFRNCDWEDEEVVDHLPVQQGHNFETMILVEHMSYKVAFNGRHFADFKHRLLFSTVKTLRVNGCVTIRRVEQRPPLGFTMVFPMNGFQPVAGWHTTVYNPVSAPRVRVSKWVSWLLAPRVATKPTPFLHPLPGGQLKPGLLVYISGRPHSEANSFSINFQCGGLGSDVAFHFNPRFRHKEMVRNTFQYGVWGTEERMCPGFPFAPGVHFDLLIRVRDAVFDVAVNGQHYLQYQHRLQPLHCVSDLSIEGDVQLASCKLHQQS